MIARTESTAGATTAPASTGYRNRRIRSVPHLHSDSPSWPDDLREETAMVRYLAPVEIAYMTGFHVRTVLSWLKDGKLEGTKISGHWRVHPDKLKAFIESGYHGEEKK